MQRLTMVRYGVRPEAVEENERLSRAVFDEVRANAPPDVAYALYRQGDEFIHLFLNLREDNSDAVTGLASFDAYQADLAARCTTPPQPVRLSVELVDSYGLPA
jgi:hypothetical protein